MRAGRLRKRVAVQSLSETENGFGQKTKTWSTSETRWAFIEPLSGRELEKARAVRSDVTHRVTMRAGGLTVTPEQRLLFGSRILNIASITNTEERNRELIFMCTEVAAGR